MGLGRGTGFSRKDDKFEVIFEAISGLDFHLGIITGWRFSG
jgi:hypothetical protein